MSAEHLVNEMTPVALVPYLVGPDSGCGCSASPTIAQEPCP